MCECQHSIVCRECEVHIEGDEPSDSEMMAEETYWVGLLEDCQINKDFDDLATDMEYR